MLASLQKYSYLSVNNVLLFVALFIVLFDNQTLWMSLWNAVGSNPLEHILFFISFAFFLVLIMLLLLSLFGIGKIIKPVTIFILLLSSIVAYFIDNMNIIFSDSMIQNFFETDFREAFEFAELNLFIHVLFFGVLPSIFIWKLNINKQTRKKEIVSRIKLLSVMLLITALSALWNSKEFIYVFRENRSMRYLVNPVYPLSSFIKYVKKDYKNYATHKQKPAPIFDDAIQYQAVANNKQNILILVVGETARAQNFSLNRYARNTNPYLQHEDIVNFTHTSSCATSTAQSVPCMFSDLEHDNFKNSKARSRENLLDGLSIAGINVLWRDNNSSCKGVCARVQSEDLRFLDVDELCNEDECHDEILLYKLDDYLKTIQRDVVIVMHQMGSHGPAYYKRYPKEFAAFKPECNISAVHKCNKNEILNAYDNSILYTDYFLSKVIGYLKSKSEQYNTAMIYMSDHGESLGEKGLYLHGLPYFMAPEEQTHIPFIVWLSDGIQQLDNIDINCLRANRNKPYSHDNFMHSVLGLMNVNTHVYQQDKDIFAPCKSFNMVKGDHLKQPQLTKS